MANNSQSEAGTDSTVDSNIQGARTSDRFKDADADLILCSGDQVLFHVHRWILSKASSLFKTMLSLKQPAETNSQTQSQQLDCIDLPENSLVIDALLRFIYPVPNVSITSIDELSLFLDVAVKYDVPSAVEYLRGAMLEHRFLLGSYPAAMTLYAMAIRYSFFEVASAALKEAVSRPLSTVGTLPVQARFITGQDYHRLVYCQRMRADAAREVVANSDLHAGNMLTWTCDVCSAHGCSWWKIYKDTVWRSLGDEPTSMTLWNKTIIEQSLFRGCEKRYFFFGRAVELGYFESLKKTIDDLPWEFVSG